MSAGDLSSPRTSWPPALTLRSRLMGRETERLNSARCEVTIALSRLNVDILGEVNQKASMNAQDREYVRRARANGAQHAYRIILEA